MFDVVVVGGGAGGISASIEASKNGSSVLLIEREKRLGGILNQCIHNGFGLHYFNEELTGPEYAHRIRKLLKQSNVEVLLNTFVTRIDGKNVTYISENGKKTIEANAVVISTGAMERNAGAINLAGNRPAGIITAGMAQKFVNLYGKLPCLNPVILGSGDIGLIMARRLTFEGAKVEMILEINGYTSGLARNIQQCVKDFNIPLLFNTTITRVVGDKRVEGIYYANVDEKFNIVPNSEKFVKCDGVILSIGLTPDISFVKNLKLNPITNGAIVDEYRQTNISGVFACGNALHIHDLVDNVSYEGEVAGKNASLYAKNQLDLTTPIKVECGEGVRYTVPNSIYKNKFNVEILFRVGEKHVNKFIFAKTGKKIIAQKFCVSINPGEMQSIIVDKNLINKDLTISIGEMEAIK